MKTDDIRMYWWNQGNNFGDVMNPILISELTGRKVSFSDDAEASNFAAAGSLIDNFHLKSGWQVWGSGMIQKDVAVPSPLTFHAVRGKLTRTELIKKGFDDVPEVYGDPGLLLPAAITPNISNNKKYDVGIIPHTSFRLNPAMYTYKALNSLSGRKSVTVISPKLPPQVFVSQLLSCERIYANSLHGIIAAMAYKIPCHWITFENDIFEARITSPFIGDDFKYYDFFSALDIDSVQPSRVRSWTDLSRLDDSAESFIDKFRFNPAPLLGAFPFRTDIFKKKSDWLIDYYSR
jgi:pyruvyltransferase